MCFAWVGVGDDGETDAGGLQVGKEVRDAGKGGDAAAFQGVVEPVGCGECGEVVLSGKAGGYQAVEGVVEVEEDGFREGHSVGKELGGEDVIAAGFLGDEGTFLLRRMLTSFSFSHNADSRISSTTLLQIYLQ